MTNSDKSGSSCLVSSKDLTNNQSWLFPEAEDGWEGGYEVCIWRRGWTVVGGWEKGRPWVLGIIHRTDSVYGEISLASILNIRNEIQRKIQEVDCSIPLPFDNCQPNGGVLESLGSTWRFDYLFIKHFSPLVPCDVSISFPVICCLTVFSYCNFENSASHYDLKCDIFFPCLCSVMPFIAMAKMP